MNHYSEGYGNLFPDSHLVTAFFREIRRKESTTEHDSRVLKILDIGCGVGANLLLLEPFEKLNYLGIDINSVAIDIAAKRISSKKLSERARVQLISTEDFLAQDEELFDFILDRASLQHHEVMQNDSKRGEFMGHLASKLSESGSFISVWAGSENTDTSIRFTEFSPFEALNFTFHSKFNLVRIQKISKYEMLEMESRKTHEEYLIVARQKQ